MSCLTVRATPHCLSSPSHDAVICDWPSVCEALAGVSIQRCWMIFNFLHILKLIFNTLFAIIAPAGPLCWLLEDFFSLAALRYLGRSKLLLVRSHVSKGTLLVLLFASPARWLQTLSRLDSNWCLRAAEISFSPRSLRTITHCCFVWSFRWSHLLTSNRIDQFTSSQAGPVSTTPSYRNAKYLFLNLFLLVYCICFRRTLAFRWSRALSKHPS